MNTNPGSYVGEEDLDWEIVPFDWWNTSFMAVSWSYNYLQGSTPHRTRFQGSLFVSEKSTLGCSPSPVDLSPRVLSKARRSSEEDDELNLELVGVKFALEAVKAYEKDVGFDFLDLGILSSSLANKLDLSADVDEKDLQVGKDQWNEMLEELMNGPAFESTTDSDESLESSFIDSISSYGSIDSIPMPTTPKPKPYFSDVEIKTSSPSGSPDGNRRHAPHLSPTRSLSATASSFVPTFCSQLSDEPTQLALSSENPTTPPSLFSPSSAFANFTFPTLNPASPSATKVKKDDQGFFSDVQGDGSAAARSSSDLLPAFLQNPSQRNRSRKSRTREIVDQLRSQTAPDFTKSSPNLDISMITPNYASLSTSPTSEEDTTAAKPRLSVSEDGGGPSRLSTPWDDDDGWIDISQPVAMPEAEQKSKRTRELFLALTRRRTDSSSSGDPKETRLAVDSALPNPRDMSTSPSPAPSPSPSPLNTSTSNAAASSDGWIESKPNVPPEPQKKSKTAPSNPKDSHSHSRKRSSHHSSRTSISSTSSSHVQTFSAASPCYPQLSPTLIPHPHSQHMVSPQTAAFPYFFPAYPAVPMTSPYAAAFLQMPGYPMGMPMHGHGAHLVPTAGTVVHPMAGIQYMMPTLGAPTKPAMNMASAISSPNVTTSHRAKHTLW
ncbi:hypothetical protein JR316_0002588 [Psilocybe cubensis]|uniref:Uncharacterized protein n=2 Tax=Psilocybe cubensis TaxID=181762 RepID=A0A8H7Y607_PSICU|nr:hypothetical protein JR316_0002588 [Psilocybe cubensis]KAH9485678.1 hypothetical protein JR316_0002588 [Psilocybe cubensis]